MTVVMRIERATKMKLWGWCRRRSCGRDDSSSLHDEAQVHHHHHPLHGRRIRRRRALLSPFLESGRREQICHSYSFCQWFQETVARMGEPHWSHSLHLWLWNLQLTQENEAWCNGICLLSLMFGRFPHFLPSSFFCFISVSFPWSRSWLFLKGKRGRQKGNRETDREGKKKDMYVSMYVGMYVCTTGTGKMEVRNLWDCSSRTKWDLAFEGQAIIQSIRTYINVYIYTYVMWI